MQHSLSRVIAATLTIGIVAIGGGETASAHDPIFVTDDQTTPDTGPYMPDGTISWALYGTVLDDGDTRGFEFDLREGDEVFVSLLIPNLSPEVDLSDDDLPVIELKAPDGMTTVIEPVVREVFDEPFSQTSYVTLAEYHEPGQAGRYRGVIVGGAPARFSVAIGETEEFFTPTERSGDRVTSFLDITEPLTAWYTTLPGGEPDPNQLEAGEAEIDLDLIEEAMESGEASAPDGALADEADPAATAESDTSDDDEADVVERPAEAGQLEAAGESSSSSSATWIAPAAIAAVAVLGAGVFFVRRRQGAA